MNRRILLLIGFAILLLLSGCGPKAIIPPEIDLTRYSNVGVIGFGCNAEAKMDEYATRRFKITIKAYQNEIHLIDLGTKEEVLESVGAEQLNPEAIRAIGDKYNLDVVLTGELEVKEILPLVPLSLYWRPRPIRGKTQIGSASQGCSQSLVECKAMGNESRRYGLEILCTGRRSDKSSQIPLGNKSHL